MIKASIIIFFSISVLLAETKIEIKKEPTTNAQVKSESKDSRLDKKLHLSSNDNFHREFHSLSIFTSKKD